MPALTFAAARGADIVTRRLAYAPGFSIILSAFLSRFEGIIRTSTDAERHVG
jgi:hypothetical protein